MSGSELIWAALEDGGLACVSARGGAVLTVLPGIRSCSSTCMAKVFLVDFVVFVLFPVFLLDCRKTLDWVSRWMRYFGDDGFCCS